MAQEKNDNVNIRVSGAEVDKQLELYNNDLQSRTRAIMAIYDVNRLEAEKIVKEISEERL